MTTDWSISAWVKLEQLPSTAGTIFTVAGKHDNDTNNRGYAVRISTTDKAQFFFYDEKESGNLTLIQTNAATFAGGDVGSWVHLVCTVDLSAAGGVIYKNNSVQANSAVLSDATTMTGNAAPFALGALNTITGANQRIDGVVDEVGIWSRIIDSTEVSSLYNSGAGFTYPFSVAPPPTPYVAPPQPPQIIIFGSIKNFFKNLLANLF